MIQPGTILSIIVTTSKDTSAAPNMVNICHIIRKQGKSPSVLCYGYIADQNAKKNSRFGVYPPEAHDYYESATLLLMKYVLEDKESRFPRISYRQRMKLAVDISSNLLQLNGTPWFPDILTSNDIFFMVQDKVPIYDRAFVSRGPPFVAIHQAIHNPIIQSHSTVSRQSLFALGTILVELLLLRTLNHVWTPECSGSILHAMTADQIKDWEATKGILNQVEVVGGSNYYSAVRRFLFYDFTHVSSSQNEEVLYEEIYGKAIALLVEDRSLSQF